MFPALQHFAHNMASYWISCMHSGDTYTGFQNCDSSQKLSVFLCLISPPRLLWPARPLSEFVIDTADSVLCSIFTWQWTIFSCQNVRVWCLSVMLKNLMDVAYCVSSSPLRVIATPRRDIALQCFGWRFVIVCSYRLTALMLMLQVTLHWRHNDHDGVSYHQPHGC